MIEPRPYQLEVFERYKDSNVIPLFASVGTGKTLMTSLIANYKYKTGQIDCLLVIAPNGIDWQWAYQEMPLYAESGILPERMVITCDKEHTTLPYLASVLNVVCVNIDQFSTPSGYLRYTNWANSHKTMIVVDEATRIKNSKSKRTQRVLYEFNEVVRRGKTVLKSVPKSVARAVLTGTPVTESPCDLWSIFEFLQPSYFGMNEFAFRNRYQMTYVIEGLRQSVPLNAKMWGAVKASADFSVANTLFGVSLDTYETVKQQDKFEGAYKHVSELKQILTKDATFLEVDLGIASNYVVRNVEMTKNQARAYKQMASEYQAIIEDRTTSASAKITVYLRLQQITSGFIVPDFDPELDEDPTEDRLLWLDKRPPKMVRLLEDVEELESCLIITRFSAEAALLFDALNTEYPGQVVLKTGWRNVGSIPDFQSGAKRYMIANINTVAMGFNLQNTNHILFYSNTFSAENRIQAEGRIRRTGQQKDCTFVDYIHKGTIDERLLEVLSRKKDLASYITEEQTIKVAL